LRYGVSGFAVGVVVSLTLAGGACSDGEAPAGPDVADSSAPDGAAGQSCTPIVRPQRNLFLTAIESECLSRSVQATGGRIDCVIAEATLGECSCSAASGREAPESDLAEAVRQTLRATGACDGASGLSCSEFCVREVVQLDGEDLARCQNDPSVTAPSGFCYVDPAAGVGSASVVADCSLGRKIRVLGDTEPDALRFISCGG
jgi:hypothetical protein